MSTNHLMGKGRIFKGSGPHFKKGRARYNQLSPYCTTIATKNGNTCITYRETVIVEFDHENIILRTGGWDTVTTRRKMNQASRQFELGYSVCREQGTTHVYYGTNPVVRLVDGLQIKRVQS